MDPRCARGAGGDCPQLPIPIDVNTNLDDKTPTPTCESVPEEGLLEEYESHFKWISTYSVSTGDLIRFRQKVKSYQEELSEREEPFCYLLANGLQQSVLDALIPGNPTQIALDNLDTVFASFPADLPAEHLRAFSYLVMIERCNIISRSEDTTNKSDYHNLLQEIKNIDISDPKTTAAVLVVKSALLGRVLGDTIEKLNLIQQVVALDPERSDWFRLLYYSIRRARRERDFTSTPSSEEIDACLKGYALEPDKGLGCMAELYHDTLKALHFSGLTNKLLDEKGDIEMSREMLSFMRTACDSNPNSIDLNIRLAEMFCDWSLSSDFRNLDMSEKQFEYCLKEWPNSSHVLHKVGKFYTTMKKNPSKGIEFFEQALESESDNYPCLMDYLRILFQHKCRVWEGSSASNVKQYENLIKILDDHLPLYHIKKVLGSKLKCSKACLLWKLNRRDEAIQLWLEAVTQDPDILGDDIMKILGSSSIFRDLFKLEDFKLILEALIVRQTQDVDGCDGQSLKSFIESLGNNIENWILFGEKGNNPNWRQTTSQRRSRGDPTLARQLRYLSVCDTQPDWRSQPCSDTSSVTSETSTICSGYSARSNSNYSETRGRYLGRGQYEQGGYRGRRNSNHPNPNGSGDGFPVSNLQSSHQQYGSSSSISSTATYASTASTASTSSAGSSFSRTYGFPRPYKRDTYKSKSDADDNWRCK